MTVKQLTILCFSATLLTSVGSWRATAATIASVSTFSLPGASTGNLGPLGNTPAINNDDVPGASPNAISSTVFLNSPGASETEFVLGNSGGTTEYLFTQAFLNTRNALWQGFVFELGFGTGSDFVLANSSNSLRFDTLNGQSTASSPFFVLAMQQPNRLDWTVATAPLVSPFAFAVDVPDGLESANPSGLNRFTLRQTPIVASPVPEPSMFGLTAVALLGILRLCYTKHNARW